MFKQDLANYVRKNPSVIQRKSIGDGLYILKYRKKAFYKGIWNRFTEECRGVIVDEDYNVVTMPFTKIYNFGIEKSAPEIDDDEMVTVFRKVNGFMGAATWHDGDALISTTGSTDSPFVQYIKDMVPDWDSFSRTLRDNPDKTFLFEVVHPSDPHIVIEAPGLYLLAYRDKEWHSKIDHDPGELHRLSKMMKCFTPECHDVTMGALRRIVKTVDHEGFVVYCDDGRATKIKSPYYLTAKFMARIKDPMKLMEDHIKERVDEEYYPLVDKVRENIVEFKGLTEQERLEWIRSTLAKYGEEETE